LARRIITVRDVAEILDHWQAGRSIRAISHSLGVSRPTIRKYISIASAHGFKPGGPCPAEGWQAFLKEAAPEIFNPALGSAIFAQLRYYQEAIKDSLEHTNVMTSWLRLREDPETRVSYSSFYRYVKRYLPEYLERNTVTVRREDPPPGEEVQIDYGYLGLWRDHLTGKRRRLWVFIMILSHSRHMFARAVWRVDQISWLESHIAGFDFLGGVPRRVVLDNLTSGVLKADLYDPKINHGYEELAYHYHVLIDPARAGKPKDKPRVERMIPYIRASFWAGRDFSSLDDINRELESWCLKLAGHRVHGTTRKRPYEVFQAVEQVKLRPLPPEPYEIATWNKAKVGRDCYFYAGGSGYTAPYQYYGKEIMVRLTTHLVKAYFDGELIKTHIRVGKWQRSTDWNDFPSEKAAFFQRTPDWCRSRAQGLGEEVSKTAEYLLEDHALYHLRQVHAILRLGEKYGKERLNAACGRANFFGDPAYRTIKNILEKGLDRSEGEETCLSDAGALLRGPGELLLAFTGPGEVCHE
jgi:transposase